MCYIDTSATSNSSWNISCFRQTERNFFIRNFLVSSFNNISATFLPPTHSEARKETSFFPDDAGTIFELEWKVHCLLFFFMEEKLRPAKCLLKSLLDVINLMIFEKVRLNRISFITSPQMPEKKDGMPSTRYASEMLLILMFEFFIVWFILFSWRRRLKFFCAKTFEWKLSSKNGFRWKKLSERGKIDAEGINRKTTKIFVSTPKTLLKAAFKEKKNF